MHSAYVFDSVRTPFGRCGGALAGVRPDDLGAEVIKAAVARLPDLDPGEIDEVIFGNANGAGEENRNVARMSLLLAGLPVSIAGSTVNRLCGSSLDATMNASRQIETGDADVVLVGGVESMSRAPWVVPKTDKAFPIGNQTLSSTTLGWRLVNPRMPDAWTVSLGEATEQLREKYGVTRERQDEFAVRSHRLATEAWDNGFYDQQILQIEGAELARDESIRAATTVERLGSLQPAFRPSGTITAGNASPLSDGAAAVFLGSEAAACKAAVTPIARVAGRGSHAVEPQFFGIAPVEAANKALARAGIDWADVGAVELNEAFAAQALACIDQWDVDPGIVNQYGGAIALGHPLGASGARLVGTLARGLERSGDRWGVAAICIGVGLGLAIVLENVAPRSGTAA